MITITAAQMDALAVGRQAEFEAALAVHVRTHFAPELLGIDDETLRLRISECIERAGDYGIETERDICRFLTLAVIYGWEFERRLQTVWIAEALSDEALGTPSERLAAVMEICMDLLLETDGP